MILTLEWRQGTPTWERRTGSWIRLQTTAGVGGRFWKTASVGATRRRGGQLKERVKEWQRWRMRKTRWVEKSSIKPWAPCIVDRRTSPHRCIFFSHEMSLVRVRARLCLLRWTFIFCFRIITFNRWPPRVPLYLHREWPRRPPRPRNHHKFIFSSDISQKLKNYKKDNNDHVDSSRVSQMASSPETHRKHTATLSRGSSKVERLLHHHHLALSPIIHHHPHKTIPIKYSNQELS